MKKIQFTEEEKNYIIDSYQNYKKTTGQLGEEFNCCSGVILKSLKKWGVYDYTIHFPIEDLSGQKFGELTVIDFNLKRYKEDLKKTNKPHHYWICLCSCGNVTEVEKSHLKNGHTISCGHIKSKGEQIISKILQENKILYTTEYSFKDLYGYGNGLLRFDFAIYNNDCSKIKYLIEFNGEQHYKHSGGWNTEEEFKIRQFNDNKKIEYCKNNNIPLIIIPYKYLDKLSLNDLLLETSNLIINKR